MSPWFNSVQESLVEAVIQALKTNAVHNRSTLAPFRFKGLAKQLVTALGSFLNSQDEAAVREVAGQFAQQGLGMRTLLAINHVLLEASLSQAGDLTSADAGERAAVKTSTLAISSFVMLIVEVVVAMESQAIIRQRDEIQESLERLIMRRESELRQVIQELSTPIMPIADQVIVLPLIGNIDRERSQRMTACLLEAIVAHRARVVILDISGVPAINEESAAALTRTAQAARLMGAQPVLVGVSPDFASDLAQRAFDLEGLITATDLRQGIEIANHHNRRSALQKSSGSTRRRA